MKKSSVVIMQILVLAMLAAGLLTGCRHLGRQVSGDGCGSGEIPLVGSVADRQGQAAAPWVVEGTGVAGVLNFQVLPQWTDEDSRLVADEIARRLTGRLAEANLRQHQARADIRVYLKTNAALYNKRADFHVYKGELDLLVERVFDRQVLQRTQLTGEGKPGQGAAEGRRLLGAALAEQAGSLVLENCSSARTGLVAADISIQDRFLAQADADYVSRFVREVQGLEGVVSCALIAHERGGQALFRVVYFAEKFPQGLMNAISLVGNLNFKVK
ncbi:MAG: hypothetical protein PHY82_09810 [Lentisphaeria bacterium]|nr:hypothetical protein [Lentisphaeria bacterium]